jgi:hypothetical protein
MIFHFDRNYVYIAYTFTFWTCNTSGMGVAPGQQSQEQLLTNLTSPMQLQLLHPIITSSMCLRSPVNAWSDLIHSRTKLCQRPLFGGGCFQNLLRIHSFWLFHGIHNTVKYMRISLSERILYFPWSSNTECKIWLKLPHSPLLQISYPYIQKYLLLV